VDLIFKGDLLDGFASQGRQNLFRPKWDRPMVMTALRPVSTMLVQGVLSAEISPNSSTTIIFAVPPIIPGHQEEVTLKLVSPFPVSTVYSSTHTRQPFQYSVVKTGDKPVVIKAEYSWIYKQRMLVPVSVCGDAPVFEPANDQHQYISPSADDDYNDPIFQQYIDENQMRRQSGECVVAFLLSYNVLCRYFTDI